MELLFKIWYLVAILPVLIIIEGYDMFMKFMSKGNRWSKFPYYLLGFLVFLLIVLWIKGYR